MAEDEIDRLQERHAERQDKIEDGVHIDDLPIIPNHHKITSHKTFYLSRDQMTGFMKRAATKGMLGKIEKYLDEVKGLNVHAAVEHDTGPKVPN